MKENKNIIPILLFLYDYMEQNKTPPTVREIASGNGITSTSATNYHIKKLVALGYVTKKKRISRSIQLTPLGLATVRGIRNITQCVCPNCGAPVDQSGRFVQPKHKITSKKHINSPADFPIAV